MEAIILAGGLGTRLRSVVAHLPKAMAPIADRPFLEILLADLARKGFKRIVLSLGFMADKISSHFGASFEGVELAYVVEDTPLGTGGALRLALTACTRDHVFVFNGDTFLDLDVRALEQYWQKGQHTIVIGKSVLDTERYGRLVAEGDWLIGFSEKGIRGPGLINAGCYVMTANALEAFPLNQSFSLEKDYLKPMIARGSVQVFVTNGLFIDIGIPEDYAQAQTFLMFK